MIRKYGKDDSVSRKKMSHFVVKSMYEFIFCEEY